MSKRPPDSSLTTPHSKQARKGSPLPCAQQEEPLAEMSNEMSNEMPHADFQRLHLDLNRCLDSQSGVGHDRYDHLTQMVHSSVSFLIMASGERKTLAGFEQFKENVNEQFMEALRKAAETPLNRNNLTALISHRMCFYFRMNQVVNII
jgi:hypothetical protein